MTRISHLPRIPLRHPLRRPLRRPFRDPLRGRLARALLALAAVTVVAGCADPSAPELDRLRVAEARWAAAGPARYAYTFANRCYCPLAELRVVVENGAVVSAEPDGEDPMDPRLAGGLTMEDLFARIRQEIERKPHEARVTYHEETGHPMSVWFDYDERAIDEEWGFEVTAFLPLD